MIKVLSIDIDYCFPAVEDWPNNNNELWEEWHPYTKWKQYFEKYPDLNDRTRIIDEECLDYMLETYKIGSVPAIVINNKYKISGSMAKTYARMIEISEYIIRMERESRAKYE